jgi:hypothetical protein
MHLDVSAREVHSAAEVLASVIEEVDAETQEPST